MAASAKPAWLDIWTDSMASLSTTAQELVRLADLHNSGDMCMVVGLRESVLKVLNGSRTGSRRPLMGAPTSVEVIQPSDRDDAVPCAAVAILSTVYVYRNLRPYFKFSVPNPLPSAAEMSAWTRAREGSLSTDGLRSLLKSAIDSGKRVSDLASQLVQAEGAEEIASLHALYLRGSEPPTSQNVITCMSSALFQRPINSTGSLTVTPPSTLVIGTEDSKVLLLSRSGVKVSDTLSLPAPAAKIRTSGSLQDALRVAALCRDGRVHCFRSTKRSCEIRFAFPPADMILQDAVVIAAIPTPHETTSSDVSPGLLQGFSAKNGGKLWSLNLPSAPIAVFSMACEPLGDMACGVPLANGTVLCVSNGSVLTSLQIGSPDDPVVACRFGTYGKQNHSIVAILKSGGFAVRALRRLATFSPLPAKAAEPREDSDAAALAIPKRTKLHVELVERERETPASIFRVFRRDLQLLTLKTREAYVSTILEGGGAVDSGLADSVDSPTVAGTVEAVGLGPTFRVTLCLRSVSRSRPCRSLTVLAFPHDPHFVVEPRQCFLDCLAPTLPTLVPFEVRCTDWTAGGGSIDITVLQADKERPLASFRAVLPVSEPPEI
jgi:Bardet-Biedl syndrome 1 protein